MRRPSTWGWVLLALMGKLAVSIALFQVAAWAGTVPVPPNEMPLLELMAASPWAAWLVVVLLAPVSEELIFRRLLFGRFLRAGRPWLGLLLTSAVFDCMHEIPGLSEGLWWAGGLLWLVYFSGGALWPACTGGPGPCGLPS